MDWLNAIIDAVLRTFLALFSWAPPLVGLTAVSGLTGIAMLWVFRRTTNQNKVRAARRRVVAYLLELRVFSTQPAMVWRSQKSLLAANGRYILLVLRPALWLAIPVGLLLVHLELFYERAPVAAGEEAIVTLAIPSLPAEIPPLRAPDGIAVEGPPVRLVDQREVSWRIRPSRAVSGQLLFTIGGRKLTKTITAGEIPAGFLSPRRVSTIWDSIFQPGEPRIPGGAARWIEVRYPKASLSLAGMKINWLLWFLIVSMFTALALKKRFSVAL